MECDALWVSGMEFVTPIWSKKMSTYAWESHMQDWQRIPGGHRTPGVASYYILLNVTVLSGNMIPFGFEEEQRNPDLAQFTDLEAEPPAKRVKKISWTAYPMVLKDPREKLMIDERNKTVCLFKKSLLEKLWTKRILAGLNMCDWTWQHMTREKVGLTRVTQPNSHHQRSLIIFQTSGAILAWNMNSLGIWVRFC